jgi:hypothetical protein
MSLILVKKMNVLLQLKVNIFVSSKHEYKTSFDAIRQNKRVFSLFFVCSLSPSIIICIPQFLNYMRNGTDVNTSA